MLPSFMTPARDPPLIIQDPVVAAAFTKPLLNACFTLRGSVNLNLKLNSKLIEIINYKN